MDALDEATERLNAALRDAEDALAELGLGVTASVALEGDSLLHFKKCGNEWGLVVSRGGDDASATSLLSKSRRTRVEAAGRLAALEEALYEAREDELRRVEKAIAGVHAFTLASRGRARAV